MCASPTSQITIKLDRIMRDGSGNMKPNNSATGMQNPAYTNINTAIGAAAADNGSSTIPNSTSISNNNGVNYLPTPPSSTATNNQSNPLSNTANKTPVPDPSSSKRRRWYLGIQSKKDPGHIMTEVYKAMLALGCKWYAMNNYRILCHWSHHMPAPRKVQYYTCYSSLLHPSYLPYLHSL